MGQKTNRIRLDQILVREGLISEEQIKEALTRQKAHGGKLGSQLLYHRYIDEAALVKALTIQFGCQGVILSKLEIPEIVLQMIPARIATARKIVPFDYIPEDNLLKVACEDPNDENLVDEIGFVVRGKQISLYVAAELALDTVISKHYQGRQESLEDRQLLEIPEDITAMGDNSSDEDEQNESENPSGPIVLLVSDEEYSVSLMQSLLERDNYEVVSTDSADDAIEIIGNTTFHTVFIQDNVAGDYLDLIDRLRKISPRTKVRYYESSSALLLDQESLIQEGDLLVRNLELFTSLLALQRKLPINHSGAVGHYSDLLCKRLGLPDKERLIIVNTAYLHDLSKHYYDLDDSEDQLTVSNMTARLLTSINYSPVVVGILQSMYKDLEGKFTKRLPIEPLGGNILTICDLFCESIPPDQKVSLDKFDAIKKKCRDLTGRLFLGEVVEAFIAMVQEEILSQSSDEMASQVMIFSNHPSTIYPIEQRIRQAGFRVVSLTDEAGFAELVVRSEPEIIMLLVRGDRDEVVQLTRRFIDSGLNPEHTPIFILVDGAATHELTDLFEWGIEDVMACDVNLDLLVTKMRKIQTQNQQSKPLSTQSLQTSGAQGQLSDMNLIDLFQALGPGLKTVLITVNSPEIPDDSLTIFLNRGRIVFAQLGEIIGAEAVYQGLAFAEGNWSIRAITEEDMPEPNNDLPNESILMEGCRRIDEKLRTGQLL